jgi:hypothetical protein
MRGEHIFENKTMKRFFFECHRLMPMVSAKANDLGFGEFWVMNKIQYSVATPTGGNPVSV